MTVGLHAHVKEIFLGACLAAPSDRFAFLTLSCGGDQALQREVESLLAFHQELDATDRGLRGRKRGRPSAGRSRRGEVIAGRYRVERLLGVGGMGEVYAVYDAMLREQVALKILRSASAAQRRRLIEEVRLARQVTHPGVCRVYDIGEDAGTVFLTMELIDGEDLAARFERTGPFSTSQVSEIALRLSEALAAAHDAGVLHRDLKPSNIMVARGGALYITDFGIATSRGRSRAIGAPGVLGTPIYMAPEETRGELATERTDLYSLGLVLYELLTGAPPFDAADLDTLLTLQREAAPEHPSRLVPGIEPDLEALVLRLLEKDPARRPQSARAVIAALGGERSTGLESEAGPAGRERQGLVSLQCELDAPSHLTADPEWPALVRIFQARCIAACRLRGGRVARHLAHSLVIEFDLPLASETAERAVVAGLEIVADLDARPLIPPERGRLAARVYIDDLDAPGRSRAPRAPRALSRPGNRRESRSGSDEMAPATLPAGVTVSDRLQPRVSHAFSSEVVVGRRLPDPRLHRITGVRQRLGLEAGLRPLTPFAGRELELARLAQSWNDAVAGRGQVLLLSGEAGLGKSRLVHELWQRIRTVAIGLEVRCSSVHGNTPLSPFVRMLEQVAGLEAEDSTERRTEKLRRALASLGSRREEVLAVLSSWLCSSAPPAIVRVGYEPDHREFIATLGEVIVGQAEIRPVYLVCEDLQWSDPTSRQMIDALVDLARTARILLVLTFRPEFSPSWKGTGVNHIALQPLRAHEARAMAAGLPASRGDAAAAIIDRADGNPLFLEELIRHHDEVRAQGASAAVPLSLRALLQARLNRLGSAKPLAQAAAVCGRGFSYALLAAVGADGQSTAHLEAGLARLVDAEILFQKGPLPRATFTFKHTLLRDVAYESLATRERRRLHELAARALPELDPDTVALRPELLARHWSEAGRPEQAFSWWKQAGVRALERSAHAEASFALEQARRVLPKLASAERRRQELELRLAIASLEMGRGAPGSAAAARSVRRAEALGAGLEGADQLAVLFLLARVRFVRGEMRTAWRMLQRLEPLIERSTDLYLRSAVHVQAGNILTCLGRLDAAEIEQQRAIEAYARAPLRRIGAFAIDPLVSLHFCRAIIAWVRGRRAESRSAFAAAIADAESLSHPLSKAMIRLYWAPVALLEGDHALFTKLITEGQTTAVAIEASWLVRLADVFAPLADASLQPLDRARTMDAVLHDCEGSSFRLFRSLGLAVLAELLASGAQPDDAVRAMDEAMVEASRSMDGFLLPEILRRRGDLLAGLGRVSDAEVALRKGVAIARRMGAFGLELRCALSLARLLAANGSHRMARSSLSRELARLPDVVDCPERAEATRLRDAFDGPSLMRPLREAGV